MEPLTKPVYAIISILFVVSLSVGIVLFFLAQVLLGGKWVLDEYR